MAGLDDLSRSEVAEIRRLIRELSMAAPLQNASIGAGGLRVYGGGVITIENGGLKVTGTAEIIGELIATGVVNFEGEVNITGPLDVSGLVTLMSDLVVASGGKIKAGTIELNPDGSAKFGTLLIDNLGKVTLQNDLTVAAGGKIKVGSSMTLDPSVSSGALVFSNGAQVFTDSTTIQVYKGTSAVTVADGTATLQGNGSNYVRVDSSGVRANGPLKATSTVTVDVMNTAPAGKTANVYWDPVDHVLKVVP
jgi:hypothetical protein